MYTVLQQSCEQKHVEEQSKVNGSRPGLLGAWQIVSIDGLTHATMPRKTDVVVLSSVGLLTGFCKDEACVRNCSSIKILAQHPNVIVANHIGQVTCRIESQLIRLKKLL